MKLILNGEADNQLEASTRLAFTSITRIPPETELENGRFGARTANYHEVAPLKDCEASEDGVVWSVTIPHLSHKPAHCTDGPSCAYLIHDDGSIEFVECEPLQPAQAIEAIEGRADQDPIRISKISPLGLLPAPEVARIEEWFEQAPKGFFLSDTALCRRANDLIGRLFSLESLLFSDQPAPDLLEVNLGYYEQDEEEEDELALLLSAEEGEEDHQDETSFLLDFSEDHILITTNEGEACLYALIALAQMAMSAKDSDQFAFPKSGMIIDSPRFAWRGMHLDVSRQVYAKQDILDFLDILAWNRFNRLHLHLTDDEGWRLESKVYPRLTEIGAWRGHELPLKPQHGSGPERHGGFFTQQDMREIIAHASELEIVVVPEIDIPGHCYSALMALPELVDPSAMQGGASVQGYVNNALNPGLAATWKFLDTIFAEAAKLFPSPWIHVGGDEVAEQAWNGSGAAVSWAKAKGLLDEDGKADSKKMQAVIMRYVEKLVAKHEKIAIGWEEAAKDQGLSPEKSPIMAWLKAENGVELAKQGSDVILCPGEAYYLDMAQSDDWDEPGLSWAGTSSVEQAYEFEPDAGDMPKGKLLGVQGCIWSENLTSRARFNHMVFPRLSAIAESAWSDPEKKDWASFKARVGLMPIMPAKEH
jgi:hexosaminidase